MDDIRSRLYYPCTDVIAILLVAFEMIADLILFQSRKPAASERGMNDTAGMRHRMTLMTKYNTWNLL